MKSKLTEGRVSHQLIKLSIPMVGGIFAVLAFSLADTYFVAKLGTKELAAMSFTFPVIMLLSSISMGLGTGASSIIARAIGEGDQRRVQRLTTDSLILSVLIVAFLAFLGLITIDPLFSALGAGAEVRPLIRDYMHIYYLGMVFLVIPLVGNSAIRACGNTLVPSLIMVLAAVANCLLDPLFIFGWGLFPALGIQGAALATALSRAGTLLASLAFLHFKEHLLLFSFSSIKGMAANWSKLLSVGLPAATTNLISPLATGLVTSLVASYGAEAVAGIGLASRLEAFALIAPLAVSASIAPFVGQNWGYQKFSRIKRALNLSFCFCLGWGALIAVVLGMAAPEIVNWFGSEPAVGAIASTYLAIVPLSYGTLGIVFTASSALNAAGKPLPALGMSFSRLLLLYVPLAYVGSQWLGILGIFIAGSLANIVVGLVAWLWCSRNGNLPPTMKLLPISSTPINAKIDKAKEGQLC